MQLKFDPSDLQPVVEQVVAEVLRNPPPFLSDQRLAYPQREAASLLSIPDHVLRDLRLSGQIQGTRAGKRWLYDRRELLRFLAEGSNT